MELVITTQEVRLGTYRASHADFRADYGSVPPPPAPPKLHTLLYARTEAFLPHPRGAIGRGSPYLARRRCPHCSPADFAHQAKSKA